MLGLRAAKHKISGKTEAYGHIGYTLEVNVYWQVTYDRKNSDCIVSRAQRDAWTVVDNKPSRKRNLFDNQYAMDQDYTNTRN